MTTFHSLREIAKRRLLDYLRDADRITRYLALWDLATRSGRSSPHPCPRCFAGHLISPMLAVETPSGALDSLLCPRCGTVLKPS